MIKVTKDISAIPSSLQVPSPENFPGVIPRPPKTTHKRRLELIGNNGYLDQPRYNDRYKQQDVRIALKKIYNGKCAFCEQKIEQSHIEHYRPKKIYYWLAFSWDNLLISCATCNIFKGKNFEIEGKTAGFTNTIDTINKINGISAAYDATEKPRMVNPEVTDPEGEIQFSKNGNIVSDNNRFSYTIDKCKIDRKHLNDSRKKLLDDYKKDIVSALYSNDEIGAQKIEIDASVRRFTRALLDKDNEYLGFRKYVLSNGWLNDVIKDKTD